MPPESHPELIECLRGTPIRLDEWEAGLPGELLTRRHGESWTLDHFSRVTHHPRLDRSMTICDLLIFLAEHDDHHLVRCPIYRTSSEVQ
jgi:hypothetical protein